MNPSGMCISHFGFVLEGASLDRLNPSAKKTIIHECEFLAVAIALGSWKDHVVAKQTVSFIDNNAVRDSLISSIKPLVISPINFSTVCFKLRPTMAC